MDFCPSKGSGGMINSKDSMSLPPFDHRRVHERDQSGGGPEPPPPHQVPLGWLPNKVPKFFPPRDPRRFRRPPPCVRPASPSELGPRPPW